ncbi:MAG: hypothetical protein J6J86_00115 [Lachnospiraceae bacterium]|nr:hypothetical protein [Lachnospiraceae bacterium]
MSQQKSGKRTLMWSVIMSSPGPFVVGLGLFAGRSSTQIADFIRRSSELLTIIMSFVVYKITTKYGECNEERKAQLSLYLDFGGSVIVALYLVWCGVKTMWEAIAEISL